MGALGAEYLMLLHNVFFLLIYLKSEKFSIQKTNGLTHFFSVSLRRCTLWPGISEEVALFGIAVNFFTSSYRLTYAS